MYPDIVLQFDWFGILNDVNAFLAVFMLVIGALFGFISRKLTLAGFGPFLIFVKISIDTDLFIFDSIFYVVMTALVLYLAIQLYEFFYGDSGGSPTP